MHRYLLLLIVFLSASCAHEIIVHAPGHVAADGFETHPDHGQYLQALEHYRTDSKAPGALMSIKKRNEQFWAGGAGFSNLEHGTPMAATTAFRTGSVTKMFTAVVVLKLVELKLLSLDQSLASALPETKDQIPEAENITIRHLLAHLSGITDPPNQSLRYQSDLINNPVRVLSVDDKLSRYVYGRKLRFKPGTGYGYSNTNYWLLGKIAERVTGKKIHQLMQAHIFDPAGMKHSYLEERDDTNVARGYADLYGQDRLIDVTIWDRAEGDGEADGGLISTAQDLTLFMDLLFEGKLISLALLEDMKRIQLSNCQTPECEYGLGIEIWRTKAGTAFGHNGGLAGIDANVLYYETTGAISVLFKNDGRGWDKSFMDSLILK